MVQLLRSAVRASIRETVKKEKEILTTFAVASQTAKAMATVCGKFLDGKGVGLVGGRHDLLLAR